MTACAAFFPVLRCATSGPRWPLALPDRRTIDDGLEKETVQPTILLASTCRYETRVSFSTPGCPNSREQKSRRQRRSRGVVEGAEMPPHCLPLRQTLYVGLREDRAATDVRRKPRAADSAQIEGPGISPLGGPLPSNLSRGDRVWVCERALAAAQIAGGIVRLWSCPPSAAFAPGTDVARPLQTAAHAVRSWAASRASEIEPFRLAKMKLVH
jgi:hypothetical protein